VGRTQFGNLFGRERVVEHTGNVKPTFSPLRKPLQRKSQMRAVYPWPAPLK
jgi:hypothetical protein